jgi:hypothetical protein
VLVGGADRLNCADPSVGGKTIALTGIGSKLAWSTRLTSNTSNMQNGRQRNMRLGPPA